jgi:hypothetical protein
VSSSLIYADSVDTLYKVAFKVGETDRWLIDRAVEQRISELPQTVCFWLQLKGCTMF